VVWTGLSGDGLVPFVAGFESCVYGGVGCGQLTTYVICVYLLMAIHLCPHFVANKRYHKFLF
jgi:hypothetical protein